MKKLLIIVGHLTLLTTFIFAWIFYKERVFYVDPGNQLFQMINHGGFEIFAQRYSMAINQLFPLLAIHLGLSLKSVVIIYSLSFVIIYYTCFIICVHGFKNITAGIGLALIPVCVRVVFGHSISETWLGIAYSAVFFALVSHYQIWKAKGNLFIGLYYLLAAILVVINYFMHPVTLFTMGFGLGFVYFQKKEFAKPYIYITTGMIGLIFLYKFFFPGNDHDESFFEGLKKFDQLIPQFKQLPLVQHLRWGYKTIYLYYFILLALAAGIAIYRRQWRVLGFTAFFSLFYFLIAVFAFYKPHGNMGNETRLLPLMFMSGILLAEVLRDMKRNYIIAGLIVICLGLSFKDLIREVDQFHTRRIRTYEKGLELAAQYPEKKFVVFRKKDGDPYINSWGSAMETLMLSSLKGKEHSKTIHYFWDYDSVDPWVYEPNCSYLWVAWYLYAKEDMLNPRYFDLECTAYREIEYIQ